METNTSKQVGLIAWSLYAFVTMVAIYVWGVQLDWSFSNLNALTVFPLFGLVAFSLMWVHYLTNFIRDTWYPDADIKKSFTIRNWNNPRHIFQSF